MAFDDRFRFSVHAVVHDTLGRVLLVRQTYGDRRWGLPGGAVEPGETIHESIRRELREELGLDLEPGPLTGLYYHAEFDAQVGIFRVGFPDGATITLSGEHSDYDWVAPDTLDGVQRIRVRDAFDFDGQVSSRAF